MYKYDNELAEKNLANVSYAVYYSKLKNLACTMFKWKNLPKTVNERFLEDCLFRYGYAVFFEADMGLMALQATLEGVNFYDEPVNIRPISPVTTFPRIPFNNCVLIRNTPDMYPTIITTLKYTQELYDIDMARDVNIKAQKTPILILTDLKQKQTVQSIYQKYNGNTPVIFGNRDAYDPNSFRVLKTDAPFVAGQLQDIKTTIYNEYLSILGIGITEFKRERSITAESEQYTVQANALANIGLSQRKAACEKINTLFPHLLDAPVDVELAANVEIGDSKFNSRNASINYTYGGKEGDK